MNLLSLVVKSLKLPVISEFSSIEEIQKLDVKDFSLNTPVAFNIGSELKIFTIVEASLGDYLIEGSDYAWKVVGGESLTESDIVNNLDGGEGDEGKVLSAVLGEMIKAGLVHFKDDSFAGISASPSAFDVGLTWFVHGQWAGICLKPDGVIGEGNAIVRMYWGHPGGSLRTHRSTNGTSWTQDFTYLDSRNTLQKTGSTPQIVQPDVHHAGNLTMVNQDLDNPESVVNVGMLVALGLIPNP